MKRIILSSRGFKTASNQYADSLNSSIFKDSDMYYADVDTAKKLVVIRDKHTNDAVAEIRLKTTPVDVTYNKYRPATPEEISKGKGLYVRDKHVSNTSEYLPEADEVSSIANKYK